jgi:ribosomal-protein-alanine N-acetyltransferase
MINRIVAESRNLNIKSIILEVSCINESAIRLYQKNGFIVEGRRKNYYRKDEDALLMRKLI